MNPLYLEIENFMSHCLTQIDCSLFESVLIMGQMKDDPRESNGVGKSVIFYAIEYALYGIVPTEVLDEVVREGTDSCKVILDLEIDSQIYRIIRRKRLKKDSIVELQQKINGSFVDISQRTNTETHNEILKLIRIGHNSFKNSVLFTQNNIDGLISKGGKFASGSDRRDILKEAFNLSIYNKYEESTKKQCGKLSKEIAIIEGIIKNYGNPEEELKGLKATLQNLEASLVDKNNKKNSLDLSLNAKKSDLDHLKGMLSSETSLTHERLNDVKIKKKQVNAEIATLQKNILSTQEKIENNKRSVEVKNKELQELIIKINTTRTKKFRPLKKVKQELENCQQNEINGTAYVSSKESLLHELKKPLPPGGNCPQCHQTVSEEHREAHKAEVAKTIAALLEDLADKKEKLKKCTNKKFRLQNELDEIKKVISYLSTADDLIKSKESELNNIQEYLDKLYEMEKSHNQDLIGMQEKLSSLTERELDLTELLSKNNNSDLDEKIKEAISTIESLNKEHKNICDEINQYSTNLGVYQEKIKVKSNDSDRIKEELEKVTELNKKLKIAKLARKAFSSGGIPALIIANILDDLQTETNKELAELKPSLEVQFTSDADLFLKYHGKIRSFGQLSSGQKMSLAFGSKIALSSIIKRRLGVNIGMLGLDEVEQPFDEKSVDNYAEIIKKLSNKFKVFVITHNNSLKDKFSNVILVEGDRNIGSSAKLVTF